MKFVKSDQRGIALVVTLSFLLVFSVVAMMLLYTITSTVKSSGLLVLEAKRFYGAEGCVLSMAAYMTLYKRADPPVNVTDPPDLSCKGTFFYLGDAVRNAVGYSTLWKGSDTRLNCKSPPPPNDIKEIEAVIFVPNAPVGYGNE